MPFRPRLKGWRQRTIAWRSLRATCPPARSTAGSSRPCLVGLGLGGRSQAGGQSTASILTVEPESWRNIGSRFAAAAGVGEKGAREWGGTAGQGLAQLGVGSASFEDVEQAAGLAGHQRGGVAGADREDRVVRRAATTGCGDLEARANDPRLRQLNGDQLLARPDDRACVERPPACVVKIRLD